jgi:hypothetical protein
VECGTFAVRRFRPPSGSSALGSAQRRHGGALKPACRGLWAQAARAARCRACRWSAMPLTMSA